MKRTKSLQITKNKIIPEMLQSQQKKPWSFSKMKSLNTMIVMVFSLGPTNDTNT